jgi:hypothetical protein
MITHPEPSYTRVFAHTPLSWHRQRTASDVMFFSDTIYFFDYQKYGVEADID